MKTEYSFWELVLIILVSMFCGIVVVLVVFHGESNKKMSVLLDCPSEDWNDAQFLVRKDSWNKQRIDARLKIDSIVIEDTIIFVGEKVILTPQREIIIIGGYAIIGAPLYLNCGGSEIERR